MSLDAFFFSSFFFFLYSAYRDMDFVPHLRVTGRARFGPKNDGG